MKKFVAIIFFLSAGLLDLVGLFSSHVQAQNRTISGNAGTGDAVISRTGTTTTVSSLANGNYSLTVPNHYSGTVTPSKPGFTFTPVDISYTDVTANQTAQNYTAARFGYTISGDAGSAGVLLSWTDTTLKSVVSGTGGVYSIVVSLGWTGTITPSRAGFAYTPASRSYTNVLADDPNENYTESALIFTVSGNTGTGNVTLRYNDGGDKTKSSNASGEYSFTVSYNWSGTVIPSKTGWVFDPRFITYSNVVANQTDQNYTASRTWTISGDAGSEGVTLAWTDTIPKTMTAGHNGNYSIVVSEGWTGTVTPSRIGYFYTPESRSYTNVVANDNNEDYAETTGRTIAGNAGVAGAVLSWTDVTAKTSTADGTGAYILTVHNHWTGTVTPALPGYGFAPVSISYTDITTNQTGKDYTATPFVTVNLNVFLSGPFVAGVMTSALNTAALIPLTSETPYPLATYGAAAKVVGSIPNADIVDWVLIELRGTTDSSSHAGLQSAFVKTDGTVVDVNGTDVLTFRGIAHGSYYVVVRHRNHLPVMSASAIPLNGASARYDFTTAQTQAFGTNAMAALDGGVFGMVAGDVTRDGVVRFTGAGSDRAALLSVVGLADPTIPVAGYLDADVNLSGDAKFTGAQSDRGVMLQMVGVTDPTIPVVSQVPN